MSIQSFPVRQAGANQEKLPGANDERENSEENDGSCCMLLNAQGQEEERRPDCRKPGDLLASDVMTQETNVPTHNGLLACLAVIGV